MLQAQSSYMNSQIQTASPGELTLILMNGCLRFIKYGISCIQKNDIQGKHTNFIKALNIVDELQATLDMQYDLSQDLYKLYEFIQHKLSLANINLDIKAAEECISLVSDLRDTWADALKSLKVSS
ncbi:flagellar export chaperone FliS [Paenibacillus sp. GCM10023252]|uniref:flagellar export chaperone FliS n=1 Tax=Paenibacillus sp. GCM10023252 TaxID=3252649 RepID=UPI003618DADD